MVIVACWLRGTPQPPGKSLERCRSICSSVVPQGIGSAAVFRHGPSPGNGTDAALNTTVEPVCTTSNHSSTGSPRPQACSAGVTAAPSGCWIEKPFLGETNVV